MTREIPHSWAGVGRPSLARGEGGMSREEWELFIEMALALHALSPPDTQRRLSRAMQRCQDAAQAAPPPPEDKP